MLGGKNKNRLGLSPNQFIIKIKEQYIPIAS